MVHSGTYIDSAGKREHRNVEFWGEWEATSTVEVIREPAARGPRWLHGPVGGTDGQPPMPQNTDPFVFGAFLYSLCRQEARPSLRVLPPGSIILFGATVAGAFALDTVMVVADIYPHNRDTYVDVVRRLGGAIPAAYLDVALHPWYSLEGTPTTLYLGATIDTPVDGMYSYVPCRPVVPGVRGFPRPVIKLPGVDLNPNSCQSHKVLANLDADGRREVWRSVLDQIMAENHPGVAIDEVPWPSDSGRPQRQTGAAGCSSGPDRDGRTC